MRSDTLEVLLKEKFDLQRRISLLPARRLQTAKQEDGDFPWNASRRHLMDSLFAECVMGS